jgi:hypothetical protein
VIIQIGEAVLEENSHIECLLSLLSHNGCYTLDIASDTHRDKRGVADHDMIPHLGAWLPSDYDPTYQLASLRHCSFTLNAKKG